METKAVLKQYGIPLPVMKTVNSKQEAVEFARQIGYPVVLKIYSKTILHKTDAGGVKLGIENEYQLREACETMEKKIPAKDLQGFIVQKMYYGHYVIVGVKRDRQFGPVIAFGLGGIFVEIMKDVSLRIAPITEKDANEMIREIKTLPILEGARGGIKADIGLLAGILVKVSKLAVEHPEIMELDLNPIVVNEKEAVAVDARIVGENNEGTQIPL